MAGNQSKKRTPGTKNPDGRRNGKAYKKNPKIRNGHRVTTPERREKNFLILTERARKRQEYIEKAEALAAEKAQIAAREAEKHGITLLIEQDTLEARLETEDRATDPTVAAWIRGDLPHQMHDANCT